MLSKLPIHCLLLKWIKILHVYGNLILLAAGAGVLYLTIRARITLHNELNLLWLYESINIDVLLAASILLIGISILGVLSLATSSPNALLINLTALLVYLLATVNYTIAIGVLGNYTDKGPLYHQLVNEFSDYNKHSVRIDHLQHTLSCCGLGSYQEWLKIPSSCCKGESPCDETNPTLHMGGCFVPLKNLIIHSAWTVVIGLALISLIEIILIGTTCVLYRTTRMARFAKLQEAAVKIPRVRNNSMHSVDPENAGEAPVAKTEEKPETQEQGSATSKAEDGTSVVVEDSAEAEKKAEEAK